MIIGIDGNEANVEEKVGVHQYSYEILRGLFNQNEKGKKHKFIVYLKKPPRNDLPKENKRWKYKILPARKVWILTKLMPHLLVNDEIDVFFSPSHYLPLFTRCPKVCTIHDLGYLEFSGQFRKYDFWQLKYWSAISLSVSKRIIAVSESTKKDIVRHYPSASGKIDVVLHGLDHGRFNNNPSKKNVRRVIKKYNINKNYILSLGTLKPSKNILGIIRSYNKLPDKFKKKYLLVIGGKKGWLYDSFFNEVDKLNLQKDVVFTGFVKEEDKEFLMKGAKVFVSPSFWEGFGMQVLESMACGTPAVVSDVSSLPEVVGDAGVYVDPKSEGEIKEGILKLLTMNSKRYNNIVNRSIQQAQKFSWEKTAADTFKVLEKAGKQK